MPGRPTIFTLRVPPGFDLVRAVCSYGYFLLAPNQWDPPTQRFSRPLRGERDRVIQVTISQPKPGPEVPRRAGVPRTRKSPGILRITCTPHITVKDRRRLTTQIARMFRLDEPPEVFARWHKLNPTARRAGFARMFRSPTLFEDIIKTFTGCNVTWRNTMTMNRLLCEKVGPQKSGAFPTPKELAACRVDWLKRNCKVGYRAGRIIRVARDVANGRLDLSVFENPARSTDEVFEALTDIYGVGEYAAGNLCQLLGRYDRLAIDTETYRHFEQQHNLPRGENPKLIHPRIEAHYAKYAPFQFLAYWFDLWGGYEERFGGATVDRRAARWKLHRVESEMITLHPSRTSPPQTSPARRARRRRVFRRRR